MFPSELSFNIVLVAVTIIIVISYAILLVKLKPSIASEEPASPSESRISIKPRKSREELAKKVENKNDAQTKAHTDTAKSEGKQQLEEDTEEKQQPKEDTEEKKSFFLFGERNFEGCPHKFGYLSSLPKNTPIPNECFGCPQIVECLRTLKTK